MKQFKIEIGLNLKGVKTFLDKSDKFFKILSFRDIPKYKFILTHLYFKLEVPLKVVKMTVKFILKIAGHLGMLGPLTRIHH
jgi:hypothetical protein